MQPEETDHLVQPVQQEEQVLLELEGLDLLAPPDLPEAVAQLVQREQLVLLDQVDRLVQLAQLEVLVQVVQPEVRVQQVVVVRQVVLGQPVLQEILVRQEVLGVRELVDRQEAQVRQGEMEHLALLVQLAAPELLAVVV